MNHKEKERSNEKIKKRFERKMMNKPEKEGKIWKRAENETAKRQKLPESSPA